MTKWSGWLGWWIIVRRVNLGGDAAPRHEVGYPRFSKGFDDGRLGDRLRGANRNSESLPWIGKRRPNFVAALLEAANVLLDVGVNTIVQRLGDGGAASGEK